jgi:lactate dehydrogenase-like 2-hydroxyacid dehydrogenase
MMRFLFFF